MKWYYEVAIDSPTQRGSLFPQEDMPDLIEQHYFNSPIYRSIYLYPETALTLVGKENSIKNYFDERWIEYVPIDIDKGKDTDEETIKRAIDICMTLENKYKLDDINYNIWFSGTGFHIDLPVKLFGFRPSKDLPYIVKSTMMGLLGEDIDLSIYSRTGLYRVNYSLNIKSGLHKIPIKLEDLMRGMEHIKFMSENIIDDISFDSYEEAMGESRGNGELSKLVVNHIPSIKTFKKVQEPINIATCVQTLYNNGPQRGTRNLASLRIASHFKRCGIPSNAAKAALLAWNNNSLSETLIQEHVENVYNRNYKYGCNDPLLKQFCNTRCIYYKNKDYSVQLYSHYDMQKLAESRESTDFEGKVIDIASLLGQYEKDCVVYPGELVTIMGPTGSGKTALMQHIILGIDMLTGEIDRKHQLDTVYLSLELSPQLMHRRNLQIISNSKKRFVQANLRTIFNKYEAELSHIKLRINSGSIKDIEEVVRTLTPKVLVIDYLDLIESEKRSEHEQLKNIVHGLSSIAVRYDIIIFAIAQVSRDYARQKQLDLYAGKGSGAIENASRKVIGLNGQAGSQKKHLSVFKNTDGELMDVNLLHDPQTLRFSIDLEGVDNV